MMEYKVGQGAGRAKNIQDVGAAILQVVRDCGTRQRS